jgi:hypothetical protein
VKVHREYFDADSVARLENPPSVVVTRHTIEHVADPVGFLRAIRQGIGGLPARLFVETPDVQWIVSRGEMEDFFYEHCSLFDAHSLRLALDAAGFTTAHIGNIFEGQYLWAEAMVNLPTPAAPAIRSSAPVPDLSPVREAFVTQWRSRIAGRRTAIWGSGAKGVTFCNLIDPQAFAIVAVVDLNPAKQGRFVPMTGHPVIGPDSLGEYLPDLLIVMNPNYRAEIAAILIGLGQAVEILVLGED